MGRLRRLWVNSRRTSTGGCGVAINDYEAGRILALRRFGLLDTAPEPVFDGITLAIANICQVPIALVSLVDTDRQWFKSAFGLRAKETPRDVAFCAHAITNPNDLMIVEDATADERFRDNPLVKDDPSIRFYAGKPLVTADGYAIGTLCVIDRQPRRLQPHQIRALDALGQTVTSIIEEHARLQKVVIDRDNVEEVLRENAIQFQHRYEDAELMLSSALQRLPAASMMLTRDGTIVAVNDAWTEHAEIIGWRQTVVGCSYLDSFAHRTSPFCSKTKEALQGLLAVLSGTADRYDTGYSTTKGDYAMRVTALQEPGLGAFVQHTSRASTPDVRTRH